eukprot:ctg_714.g305
MVVATEHGLLLGSIEPIQQLHIRKYPLGEQPRRIAHLPGCFCLLTISMERSGVVRLAGARARAVAVGGATAGCVCGGQRHGARHRDRATARPVVGVCQGGSVAVGRAGGARCAVRPGGVRRRAGSGADDIHRRDRGSPCVSAARPVLGGRGEQQCGAAGVDFRGQERGARPAPGVQSLRQCGGAQVGGARTAAAGGRSDEVGVCAAAAVAAGRRLGGSRRRAAL